MFDAFEFVNQAAGLREQQEASKGNCPPARKCLDRSDLAYWFYLAAVAAGAIHRSAETDA